MDSNHSRPLVDLDAFITRRCGARYEAELFAALVDCPSVIRSFEFAIADGALYVAGEVPSSSTTNYSERFWQLNEEVRRFRNSSTHNARKLVLFDGKSKVSNHAEDQIYVTPMAQRARVSFYLAICAANPDYVELHPNLFCGEAVSQHDSQRGVAVNISRKSLFPPAAYAFLSPCNSPYRMPLALLPDALLSIQQCAQGQGPYTNPWTGVEFPEWIPQVEHDHDGLAPREESQHYTAFIGLLEIWRGVRVARVRDDIPLQLEFMWLQPRLADFKFVISPGHQVFVQYKIDGRERSPSTKLTKVAIARNGRNGKINYYFTDHERFDYLLYQFDYQDHEKIGFTKFFFLPERILPNAFYETKDKEGDFSRAEFIPYWITMDQSGGWVKRVFEIIQETPYPRRPSRPSRPRTIHEEMPKSTPNLFPVPTTKDGQLFYEELFYAVMMQCATRRSGLLIVLSRGHPYGDLAYCRYCWTVHEQEAFLAHKTPPFTITNLPASTPLIPIHVYTRTRETTSRGPRLTTAEFQRLNEDSQDRLLLFDVFGKDGRGIYSPLLIVPSDDISPTQEQTKLYESNSAIVKEEGFEERVPLLAELLHTGLNPMDYTISAGGPRLFEHDADPWSELWHLLDRFASTEPFMHPPAYPSHRHPSIYRVTLQGLHQRLANKHSLINREAPVFDYSSEGAEEDKE